MSETLRIPRRVRHALKFRTLSVASVEDLTPTYRRIVLTGDDLDGFVSLGFDDHVKVFPPRPGEAPVMPTVGPDAPSSRSRGRRRGIIRRAPTIRRRGA